MNHRLSAVNNHFPSDAQPLWTLKTFIPFEFEPTESKSMKG